MSEPFFQINVGHILQIASMLGGLFYVIWFVGGKIAMLASQYSSFNIRLDKFDNKLEQITGVIVQLAKQEERMDAIDKRLQELSNRLDIYSTGRTRHRKI